MAYVTIEKDGAPWMLCHATDDVEIDRQIKIAETEAPTATFTRRLSTPEESEHCAEAMDAEKEATEDPFRFFVMPIREAIQDRS